MDGVPSVSFGIARIATCRGRPKASEGWTRCHLSVLESLERQLAAAPEKLFEGWCHSFVSESLELQRVAAAQMRVWTGCHPSELLVLQPAAVANRLLRGGRVQFAAAAQKLLKGGRGAFRQFRNR